MEILRTELPKYGGLFGASGGRIAAVSLALGFSYSGYLSVTGAPGRVFR
jgi:2-oxoglutarate ferredoxin oxidoreductase subunit alpha